MNIQQHNRFLLEQKITPLINRYVYYLNDNGQKGEQIAFIEQKRFKLKEEMTAWRDKSKNKVLFSMKAENVMDVHGKMNVTNSSGKPVGYLKKSFGKSILRSTWKVYSPENNLLFICHERNKNIALLRRFAGLIPLVGELFDLIPYHFDFIKEGKSVGEYTRIFTLRDTYDLQINDDTDRLLILALGIALDALQSR
jgi:uncharacterized protein YxjI